MWDVDILFRYFEQHREDYQLDNNSLSDTKASNLIVTAWCS